MPVKIDKKFKILLISIAVLVGFVYVFPRFIHYETLKSRGLAYVPLTTEAYFDVMNVHGARLRDILDGYPFSGEVDTFEYKDGPSIWPVLSMTIFAPLIILTRSVFAALIISDFLFPALIFLSFYYLIFVFVKSRFFAAGAALFLMLFPQAALLFPPTSLMKLKNLFLQIFPWPLQPAVNLTYLRPESFIGAGPFFILFFAFVYKALTVEAADKKKRYFFIISAGVCYGLLFNFYFYFWVFATIFLGLLFIFLLIKNRSNVFGAVLIGLVGAAVSIPFWLNQFRLARLPNYQEIIQRTAGFELSHAFRTSVWKTYLLYIFAAALIFWLSKKLKQRDIIKSWFLICLSLTGVVVFNIQMVTGFTPQPDHWSGRVFLITNGVIYAAILYDLYLYFEPRLRRINIKRISFIVAFILIASIFCNVLISEAIVEKNRANLYTLPDGLMAAYEWLNKNTPKDSVVMTPSLLTNIDLPVYTHNRIFLARVATTLAPEDELLNRLFITYKFFGVNPQYLDSMIQSEQGITYFFTVKYRGTALDTYLRPDKDMGNWLPDGVKNKIYNDYLKFQLPPEIPYRADYVFIGPKEKEIGLDMKNLAGYKKVYDSGGVQIYQVEL